MADAGSFEVNGRRYALPLNLTMGEMCDAENYFGVTFGDPDAGRSMRMAAALMYLGVRRDDPTVTVEDIRDLPMEVFETFLNAEDDASPPPEENVGESESSGQVSTNGSARPDVDPSSIGSRGSDIGSDSALVTLQT